MQRVVRFIVALLFLSPTISKAQYVTIPNQGFVNFLQYTFPSCMTGNLMDTTCVQITSATSLTIPQNYNVSNVYGIQFFDNLQSLTVNYNPVTSLPYLPQNLTTLNAAYCNLTSVTNLPPTLTSIQIQGNSNLTSLPALPQNLNYYIRSSTPLLPIETSLPASLQTYHVQQCNAVNLPALPAGLLDLSIGSNWNINFPILPAGLEKIGISYLSLTSLPSLPSSLLELWADHNNFTSLNSFPPNLDKIYVNYCPTLTSIQNLPNSLTQLYANNGNLSQISFIPNSVSIVHLQNNNLTSIPNFPNSAWTIDVSNNNLTSIPSLPPVVYNLNLSNNSLFCLPFLPTMINPINIDNNNFTCLPNIIPSMSPVYQSYPLCENNDIINNPYGCLGAEGVEGHAYSDLNNNCTYEATDIPMKNVPIIVFDNSGNTLSSASTYTNGRYFFDLVGGQYDVVADTISKPYVVGCLNPGIDSTVVLNAGNPLALDVNFNLECKPGFDIGTKSIYTNGIVFPGQPHTLIIKAGDMTNFYNLNCSNGVSGNLIVTVNGPVTFQGVTPGSLTPTISGNQYSYSISNFGTVNPNLDFRLDFLTDTTAIAGNSICVTAVVTPTAGDNSTANNNYTTCIPVVNSYDPNNKIVYPGVVSPGFTDYITYTINFQNTGNAPAFNIRLEDTLSPLLDVSTFELLDYSHEMHYKTYNNKLTVYFPNIMLVDSTTSEPDSKGHITFRIKPFSGLAEGVNIENTGYIFFDFNPAIITNTVVTSVEDNASSAEITHMEIDIYPNPTENIFYIKTEKQIQDLTIFDIYGKKITSNYVINTKTIDLNNQSKGQYFIHLNIDNKTIVKKIVKN
jgi:uncharacterized repeat protein (TIGR01451 family)